MSTNLRLPQSGKENRRNRQAKRISGWKYVRLLFSAAFRGRAAHYTSLLKGVSLHRESVEILGADTEKIGKVYQFLLNDHPELFWCSGTLQMTHYPMAEKIELFPEYLYDSEESMRRQKKSRVRHRNGLRIYLKMFRNMRKSNIFMSRLSGGPSIRKVERTIRIFIVCCKMGSLSVQDMPRQCSIWQGR